MSSSLSSELSQDGTSKRKALLTRSNAMCGDDDTRLRPPDQLEQSGVSQNSRTKRYSPASSVSKDSSYTDYTDSTGIDLMQFIINTLHKNAKDREMLLTLEAEMRKFVLDKNRQVYKFPKMSSYNRMLVHRVAAFFGLDHNIDQSGTLVVITKTPNSRIPDLEFSKCIKNNMFTDRLLCRRNVQSFDECQLNNMYANFPTVQPNLAFGSAAAMPAIGVGPSLPPSLEMVRRARSFEVGEWHNSMATPGSVNSGSTAMLPVGSAGVLPAAYLNNSTGAVSGNFGGGCASSSNSSSSWQLAGGDAAGVNSTSVSYTSSRPESIVSPGSGIVMDPNSAVYYTHQPPPPTATQLIIANNAQQQLPTQAIPVTAVDYQQRRSQQQQQAFNGQCKIDNEATNGGDAVAPVDGNASKSVDALPVQSQQFGGYMYTPLPSEYAIMMSGGASFHTQQPLTGVGAAATQYYSRPPNITPVFYTGGVGSTTVASCNYAQSATGSVTAPYYIAPYTANVATNSLPPQPPVPIAVDETFVKQFQQSMQLNSDGCSGGMASLEGLVNNNGATQLIPYNTPNGMCYITVGAKPTSVYAPVCLTIAQQQQVQSQIFGSSQQQQQQQLQMIEQQKQSQELSKQQQHSQQPT